MTEPSCEELIGPKMAETFDVLRRMLDAQAEEPQYKEGDPAYDEGYDLPESFGEYGLSFDYVAPGTFGDHQKDGYFRYQMSWGGPSDELRFYGSPGRYGELDCDRAEYVYMDWFDGASRRCCDGNLGIALEVLAQFDHGNLGDMIEDAETVEDHRLFK